MIQTHTDSLATHTDSLATQSLCGNPNCRGQPCCKNLTRASSHENINLRRQYKYVAKLTAITLADYDRKCDPCSHECNDNCESDCLHYEPPDVDLAIDPELRDNLTNYLNETLSLAGEFVSSGDLDDEHLRKQFLVELLDSHFVKQASTSINLYFNTNVPHCVIDDELEGCLNGPTDTETKIGEYMMSWSVYKFAKK